MRTGCPFQLSYLTVLKLTSSAGSLGMQECELLELTVLKRQLEVYCELRLDAFLNVRSISARCAALHQMYDEKTAAVLAFGAWNCRVLVRPASHSAVSQSGALPAGTLPEAIARHRPSGKKGQAQSTVNVEGSGLDLRRMCAALGWRAPPRGEASGRITISFPGIRWDEAKISTGFSVAITAARRLWLGPLPDQAGAPGLARLVGHC